MKTLVVYYSKSGNNQQIAEYVAKKEKADIEGIIDSVNRDGFGMIKRIVETLFGFTPSIKPLKYNPRNYDRVIFCTPVWVGRLPSPSRTFITQYTLPQVVIISSSGKGDNPKAMDTLKNIANASRILELRAGGEVGNKMKLADHKKRIDEFLKKL